MSELKEYLVSINDHVYDNKPAAVAAIGCELEDAGYMIVDLADQKPWGAYFRIDGSQAETFIADFFPSLSVSEARLGIRDAELSPKVLLVEPRQRLSWQYHDRRAERWMFLTTGAYVKSQTDEQTSVQTAQPGEVVQFQKGERHRLVGAEDGYTVVAEIWQHADRDNPSNEDDIVRVADDYQR
ncbi:MAG: mannose-6-phosphate isomerase [Candidatus Saccharibacteria bacterium]|nr:mannose-6-phosphate isomerase [Candidatus Saccharibacteria bacterium]